ncbi:377_t:CDS:1 [Ambispora gerdemannii]|uniref:377_t:CDS:1 n=1 Tax=Ambispora gerdemannii TaxID=144530 RepID=A0A9N8YXF1_9GLOM|nr:377_t:CDS:1 [Ambispora gerdemannii]
MYKKNDKSILIDDVLFKILELVDPNTLLDCLLVNRNMYQLAIQILWRAPRFRVFQTVKQFCKALEFRPHNAKFVRELNFNIESIYNPTNNNLFISIVKNCHNLVKLYVSFASLITDEAIITVSRQCPDLKTIELCECDKLTDISIKALANGCNRLLELDLERCNNLTPRAIDYLAQRQHLEVLNLNLCGWVNDDVAYSMSEFYSLRVLKLSNCTNVTSKFFTTLTPYTPHLKELHITRSSEMKDEGVISITKNCPELEVFVLCGCNISDLSMYCIAENLKNLKKLDVTGCSNITDKGLELALCLNLTSLRTNNFDLNADALNLLRSQFPKFWGDAFHDVITY